MTVSFLDLHAQLESIRAEIDDAIAEVVASCAYAGGPFVARFERSFAAYCGSRYAIGVGSGTEALWMALLALGIGPGDEVITVPNSFLATAEAISFTGASPRFVDVDPQTYTMDPLLLPEAITERTKAIVPVHLFGQMANMDAIMRIARAHGLHVVEDACQAHGAEHRGRKAGSIGDLGCYSFYPGKNLGAFGEAGAIVTESPEMDAWLRMFRDHGQREKYSHEIAGWNGRMDGIQGAILDVKLKYLDSWNDARRAIARQYEEALGDLAEIVIPTEAVYGKHVYHIYAIRHYSRDRLIRELREAGVQCGIHYPVPIHRQQAYTPLGLAPGSFPVAETCSRETLSLPMFPELSPEQVDYVARSVRKAVVCAKEAAIVD